MKRFTIVLLLALFILPRGAVADESAPVEEMNPAQNAKKATKSVKSAAGVPDQQSKQEQQVEGPSYDETANFILNRYPKFSSGKFMWEIKEWSDRCVLKSNYVSAEGNASLVNTNFTQLVSVEARDDTANNFYKLYVNHNNGAYQWWYFTDKTMRDKFYKAFQHMRKLCSAKDDPF